MDLTDLTPEKFFNKVTYASDATPAGKLVIPNGDFVNAVIDLRFILAIEDLIKQLEKNRVRK